MYCIVYFLLLYYYYISIAYTLQSELSPEVYWTDVYIELIELKGLRACYYIDA